MKTHLVFIITLLLVAAVIKLDAHQLNAVGWLSAAMVAAVFAIANTDAAPRRAPKAVRAPGSCAAWEKQNSCVLCAGTSS
jgi:hypothetical protein